MTSLPATIAHRFPLRSDDAVHLRPSDGHDGVTVDDLAEEAVQALPQRLAWR
jgi:hypothetical protein